MGKVEDRMRRREDGREERVGQGRGQKVGRAEGGVERVGLGRGQEGGRADLPHPRVGRQGRGWDREGGAGQRAGGGQGRG